LGMGVKFLNLSRRNVDELNRLIAQLTQTEPLQAKEVDA
jgi:hypothetical protein